MTDLTALYNAILAQMQQISGVEIAARKSGIELARMRLSQPIAVLNWVGTDGLATQLIGSEAQELVHRWEIDILAPGNPSIRLSAEESAYQIAVALLDILIPPTSPWRPAPDCGPLELDEIIALGDVQNGYALAVMLAHRQWRE